METTDIQKMDECFRLLDHAPIGQFVLRKDFVVVYWNRCLEAWTGIARDLIIGTNILDRFPHLGTSKYETRIRSIFGGGPPTIFSSQLHKHVIPSPLPGGKFRFQYTVVTGIPAPHKGEFYALFAIQDVTSLTEAIENHRQALKKVMEEMEERQKAQAELVKYAEELQKLNRYLKEQAIRDGLTGLFNHRYFYQVLRRDFLLADRHRSDIGCILIDLDHFKSINDSYGHPCGDLVLKEVAYLIRDEVRSTDLVARYGGEEFAVLLPHTALAGAKVIAEQIRIRIEKHTFWHDSCPLRITASLGISSRDTHLPNLPEELLAFADKALYRAKATGRNRVMEYSATENDETFSSPQVSV